MSRSLLLKPFSGRGFTSAGTVLALAVLAPWAIGNPAAVPPAATGPERGYLGVLLSEICPEVRAQTPLKDGEGLMIGRIAPDSPAAQFGLLQYDILTKFNDQRLMSPGQFVTLVENAGPGAEADITYLRRGSEVKAKVRLGCMPAKPMTTAAIVPLPEEMLSAVIRSLRDNPPLLEKVHRLLRGGGLATVTSSTGGIEADGTSLHHGARTTLRDHSGIVELVMIGNSQKVKAWDSQNQLVFSGPCDTPEQFQALPEELRERVARIQKEWRQSTARGTQTSPLPAEEVPHKLPAEDPAPAGLRKNSGP